MKILSNECKDTIDNTFLIILLILFCNVFKALKWKYMLNLTSSEKTSEILLALNGYFSLSKTSGPTAKALGSEVLL